jgi:renalase
MNPTRDALNCVVIGAGLSGLVAATVMHQAGKTVAVLEQDSAVGGRMASWRSDAGTATGLRSRAVFDLGAQYFTIRDERFDLMVDSWKKEGFVREWSRGFATSDGSFYSDGIARYRGIPDMAAIPEHIARGLDVRLGMRISSLSWIGATWRITIEDGRILDSDSIILTPPVPLSLALVDAGHVKVPKAPRDILNRIEYEPCIAVMVLLQDSARLPAPGGMWSVGEPISWIADNHVKGVSPKGGAVTVHAGPDFSHDQWLADDVTIVRELVAAAGEWLGSPVIDAQVKRWPYSKPYMTYPEPVLHLRNPGPLIFAGDAFAGPRIEGAALSGLAAAAALL